MKKIRLSKLHVKLLNDFHPKIVDGYAKLISEVQAGTEVGVPESMYPFTDLLRKWVKTYAQPHAGKRTLSPADERFLLAITYFTLGVAVAGRLEPGFFLRLVKPNYRHVLGY